jgi:hypothetical protein
MHGRRSDGVGGRFSLGVTPLGVLGKIVVSVAGDVLGDVSGPALGRFESDHAESIAVLAGEKIADDGLPIGLGGVGLIVGEAELAVVVRAWRTTPLSRLHAGECLSPEDRQPGHLDRPPAGMHGPRRRCRGDGDRRNLRPLAKHQLVEKPSQQFS